MFFLTSLWLTGRSEDFLIIVMKSIKKFPNSLEKIHKIYNFLHLTLQEYLAAVYIASLPCT